MSLATRCPACGTVFRVVRDQLKVSEGWVRCGRCSEVFNAGEQLFELEPPLATPAASPPGTTTVPGSAAVVRMGAALAPPSPVPPQPTAQVAALAGDAPTAAGEALAPGAPAPAPAEAADLVSADALPPGQGEALERPAQTPAAEAETPTTDAPVQGAPPRATAQDNAAPVPADPADPAYAPSDPSTPAPDAAAEPAADAAPDATAHPAQAAQLDLRADPAALPSQPTPGFVLRAERAQRRRHPLRRSGLALLCLLMTATLAAQMALHYRDDVAARWPVAEPALQAACEWLGCRVEPPRHIDSVAVDSSGLVRVEGSTSYRLSLVVQNRSGMPVRMPAIDLALSDAQGRTTARRVLTAAELGQAIDSLPPQGEVALQAVLDLGERRVAGYTVELFYP